MSADAQMRELRPSLTLARDSAFDRANAAGRDGVAALFDRTHAERLAWEYQGRQIEERRHQAVLAYDFTDAAALEEEGHQVALRVEDLGALEWRLGQRITRIDAEARAAAPLQ